MPMLRLLYALACEQVLVAENGVTSLINILERMEAEVPPDAPDGRLMIANKWHTIAFWTRGAQEVAEPVTYEQRTVVVTPDGETFLDVVVPFKVSNENINYRNVIAANGFPLTKSGILTVEVHLRKQGDENWEKYSEYPIITERKVVE